MDRAETLGLVGDSRVREVGPQAGSCSGLEDKNTVSIAFNEQATCGNEHTGIAGTHVPVWFCFSRTSCGALDRRLPIAAQLREPHSILAPVGDRGTAHGARREFMRGVRLSVTFGSDLHMSCRLAGASVPCLHTLSRRSRVSGLQQAARDSLDSSDSGGGS